MTRECNFDYCPCCEACGKYAKVEIMLFIIQQVQKYTSEENIDFMNMIIFMKIISIGREDLFFLLINEYNFSIYINEIQNMNSINRSALQFAVFSKNVNITSYLLSICDVNYIDGLGKNAYSQIPHTSIENNNYDDG